MMEELREELMQLIHFNERNG